MAQVSGVLDWRDTLSPPGTGGHQGLWVALWARPVAGSSRSSRRPAMIGALVAAVLLVTSGLIHVHLWTGAYRHIPTVGPLFLAQGVAGVVLGLAVAVGRRPVLGLAAAAFMAASIGGLWISVWRGLFGFHETFHAPFAHLVLGVEIVGLGASLAAAALARRAGAARR